MTVRYFNASVGPALKNGDVPTHGGGKTTAQLSHVSVAYDDAVITTKNQLVSALRRIMQDVLTDSTLT